MRLVRSLLFIYVCLGVYAVFFSEGMIFRPQPASYRDDSSILKLTVDGGGQISARYLPNPTAKYTILYSHGNAEDLGDISSVLELLHQSGFAVLSYDYSGYGTSPGRPTEQAAYKNIEAAYRYLVHVAKISPSRIIVHGRSVGGGPSVELATQYPVGGLILESTFVSTFRVMTTIPILPFDRFANLSKLPRVQCPVLVIHGTQDEAIPLWHGEALLAAAPGRKQAVWVQGAGHNDLIMVAGDRYTQTIRNWANTLE